MRRIVVQMSAEEFFRLKGGDPFYERLASLDVIQVLHSGPDGASSIVRMRAKDPRATFHEIARRSRARLNLIEQADGMFTCLMKIGRINIASVLDLRLDDGYIVPPLRLDGDQAWATLVGNSAEIARFLAALRRSNIRARVVSLADLRLSPDSPLNALTEKQRRVITAAYERGYYDRPRRVSSQALAKALGLSTSTLVNHRLKAEQRLLSVILDREKDARAERDLRRASGAPTPRRSRPARTRSSRA